MFGGYVIYTFNSVTKEIQFVRDFKGSGERILLWTDNLKPEIVLIQDPQIGVWLSNWTLAQLKVTIGEAREKYGTVPGPQGGTTLNGTALKTEGKEAMLALIEELKNFVDGSEPYSWIQG
jgi:hypothetical protein